MIQSVLAILAGIVVLTVMSFAIEWVTDPVLAAFFPMRIQTEPGGSTSPEN